MSEHGTSPTARPESEPVKGDDRAPRRDTTPLGVDRDQSCFATLKRTVREFSEDNMTDWAAGLTYYGLLALFPALIALVSILGLVSDPQTTAQKLTDIVTNLGPASAADTFRGPIDSITSSKGSSGLAFFIGLGLALWSASGYVGAFGRASNVIYETREGRPFWKLRPIQLLITLAMIVMLALLALGLVLTGPVVSAVADPLGIGSGAQMAWNIAKWPVMLLLVIVLVALLYYSSPNVKQAGFKWISPGAVVAVLVWIIASAAFAFYVSNFGSYNRTYGTLGGFIALLVWFWISNLAILFGLELNSEIERNREFEEGVELAHLGIQLEPRDEPEPKQTA